MLQKKLNSFHLHHRVKDELLKNLIFNDFKINISLILCGKDKLTIS